MRWFTTCAILCGLLFAPSMARAAVIINEVLYDDGGTDDREFVELFNNGAAVDISGWVVRNSDTVAPPTDNNADFTIPPATILAAGDYYVIGMAGVPNVDQVVTGTLENDNEGMQLLDAASVVQDTLIFERFRGAVAVSPGEGGYWGQSQQFIPDLAGGTTTATLGRFVDGRDTNNNGRDWSVRPHSPGASNNSGPMTLYQPPDPTGQTVGAAVPGLTGSFVNARFMDPTVADVANNTNVIPPAPTSGNRAITVFDSSGGGDAATSNQVFGTTQGGFNIYAYLDTTDQPQNSNAAGTLFTGSEVTIYGVGGGDMFTGLTDLAGNTAVGAGTLPVSDSSNGFTGVNWVYERTAINGGTGATQTLYLVDANDGGDADLGGNTPLDWTILQSIDISGLASDWFLLGMRIDAAGNGVAWFNGTKYYFTTSTDLHSGAFNAGYRENLQIAADGTPDAIMRPATFTIVPEPGTLSLLFLGLMGLAATRRR